MLENKEIAKKQHYISLGEGEKGLRRLQTASILIQLLEPIAETKEITLDMIDKKYQNVLDWLNTTIEKWSEEEMKLVQVLIPSIKNLMQKGKDITMSDLTPIFTILSKSNVINLDRQEENK